MRHLFIWFQNHSLRFKTVVLLCSLVLFLQIGNGILFFTMVTDKFEKNITESNQATLRQIATNINRMFEDIVTQMVSVKAQVTSNQLQINTQETGSHYAAQSLVYQKLFEQLIAADNNFQFVNSMFVLGEQEENYYYTQFSYMQIKDKELFGKLMQDCEIQGQIIWGPVVEESYFFTRGDEELVSIIMPVYRYQKVKNLVVVNLYVKEIKNYMKTLSSRENQDSIILAQTSEQEVFSYDGMEELVSKNEELKHIFSKQDRKAKSIGNHYCVLTESLEINQWKISMVTSLSNIQSATNSMVQYMVIIFMTTGLVMLAGVSIIIFMITKPIQKMTQIMEANRHTRSLKYRFHAKYKDEVGVLARTYNQLMDEIFQLMDEIRQEQIQNRKSYLKMLQLQIKPHFLYNTLETVKFMVEMKDKRSVEMLEAIGKFYKLSLSGIQDIVKIREEIEHLSCYLQILKMRYNSRYTYTIQMQEEILEQEIIKFTLQPLVENAVYHGIKQKKGKGIIRITGKVQGTDILICIWDNGIGISEEKLREIQKTLEHTQGSAQKEHIGIVNVHQRICFQYGKGYGLKLESVCGEYTQVIVRLPYNLG